MTTLCIEDPADSRRRQLITEAAVFGATAGAGSAIRHTSGVQPASEGIQSPRRYSVGNFPVQRWKARLKARASP